MIFGHFPIVGPICPVCEEVLVSHSGRGGGYYHRHVVDGPYPNSKPHHCALVNKAFVIVPGLGESMSRSPDLTPQSPFADIVSRDDVINKITKRDDKELLVCIALVNKRLGEVTKLPEVFTQDELGTTLTTRQKMIQLIKNKGWSVIERFDVETKVVTFHVE